MLIVLERCETSHHYYPMGAHAPGDLTVTMTHLDMGFIEPIVAAFS